MNVYNLSYNMLCQTIDDLVFEVNNLKSHLRIHTTANEDVYPINDKCIIFNFVFIYTNRPWIFFLLQNYFKNCLNI
jgi:hypothetical protein